MWFCETCLVIHNFCRRRMIRTCSLRWQTVTSSSTRPEGRAASPWAAAAAAAPNPSSSNPVRGMGEQRATTENYQKKETRRRMLIERKHERRRWRSSSSSAATASSSTATATLRIMFPFFPASTTYYTHTHSAKLPVLVVMRCLKERKKKRNNSGINEPHRSIDHSPPRPAPRKKNADIQIYSTFFPRHPTVSCLCEPKQGFFTRGSV